MMRHSSVFGLNYYQPDIFTLGNPPPPPFGKWRVVSARHISTQIHEASLILESPVRDKIKSSILERFGVTEKLQSCKKTVITIPK